MIQLKIQYLKLKERISFNNYHKKHKIIDHLRILSDFKEKSKMIFNLNKKIYKIDQEATQITGLLKKFLGFRRKTLTNN